MANVDRPNGLSPVKYKGGAPYNGSANVYCIPAASTSAFAVGDAVITGGSADANGIATIALAAATGAIRGVIVAVGKDKNFFANADSLGTLVRPAAAQTTDWYALVVDDPDVLFEIQEVSGGTALTAAEVGLNSNLVIGTNNGYVSGMELDNASEVVTATSQLRLLGLIQRPDNAFGEHAKWLVAINVHELASAGTLGI